MNKGMLWLCLGSLMIAAGGCGAKPPHPPLPVSVWEGWIPFDQPEENLRVGYGFALAGPIETTCHTVGRDAIESASVDSYVLTWDRQRRGNLTLKIASLLGVGATARKASTGRIEFDSVFIQRATDVRPVPSCQDASRDGLPKLPAIVSLLGAKRFRYSLTDERGISLNVEAAREINTGIGTVAGSASVVDSGRRGFAVSFSTARFIAAQFRGFQEGGAPDSVMTKRTKFGQFAALADWGWQVRADTGSDEGIRLIVERLAPPFRSDTVRGLSDNQQFPFGRNPREGASGSFLTGTLFVGPEETDYMVIVRRRNIRTRGWATAAQRDSLIGWASARQ